MILIKNCACFFAFLNSFLKLELNCFEENYVNFSNMSITKEVLSNLTCFDLLIHKMCPWRWFLRQLCSENVVKFARKSPWRILWKLLYVELPLFWMKCSIKYSFLGIQEILNITNIWTNKLDGCRQECEKRWYTWIYNMNLNPK